MFTYILEHTPLFYFIQSFWRDEAFSVLFASRPLLWILQNSSFDPPIYYILLHFWMKIFGQSEIAVRSLSFVGFSLAVIIVIHLSEQLFSKKWIQWFVPILFFFNPMLLYYAFETRAYGWYMFFAVLTMYGYVKQNWKLFVIGSILGFYTHLYSAIVPMVCFIHYAAFNFKTIYNKKIIISNPMVRSLLVIGIIALPWIIQFLLVAHKFTSTWYYAVDLHLITSVLGNMYTGYEGTPWYFWTTTKWMSLILLILSIISLIPKSNRRFSTFFFCLVYIPLVLVIGVSFFKPFFVNRYVIPVTIAEVFLIGYAISSFRSKILQWILAISILAYTTGFNVWYADQHSKMDIRTPLQEINTMIGPNDVIFADNPIIFLETMYYAKDRNRVFFYNPKGEVFPWFIGDVVVDETHVVSQLFSYPTRTFIVHADGTYSMSYELPLTKGVKK
ncbi:MAG: hypothetical protein V1917_03685 [Candidatus Gottesmanbacteria bacterium]